MPNGRVHTSVTLLTTVYVSAFLADRVLTSSFPNVSLIAIGGCLAGVFLSPDLDVDNGYIGGAIIRRKLGCLPAAAWKFYWKPYAVLIPHRSFISHAPILSTAIRLVYVGWWWPFLLVRFPDAYIWLLWFAAGLAIVDFHHWFMDFVSPDKEDYS